MYVSLLIFILFVLIFFVELPLCIDTEFKPYKKPAEIDVSDDESNGSMTSGGISLTSVRWTVLVILGSFCAFM